MNNNRDCFSAPRSFLTVQGVTLITSEMSTLFKLPQTLGSAHWSSLWEGGLVRPKLGTVWQQPTSWFWYFKADNVLDYLYNLDIGLWLRVENIWVEEHRTCSSKRFLYTQPFKSLESAVTKTWLGPIRSPRGLLKPVILYKRFVLSMENKALHNGSTRPTM